MAKSMAVINGPSFLVRVIRDFDSRVSLNFLAQEFSVIEAVLEVNSARNYQQDSESPQHSQNSATTLS